MVRLVRKSCITRRSRFSQHAPFEVEVGNAPLARTHTSEGLQPDSARLSETGTAKAAEGAEKSKRKGRFQIVEEDAADPAKQNRVGRSSSAASMDTHRSNQVSFHSLACNCSEIETVAPMLKGASSLAWCPWAHSLHE